MHTLEHIGAMVACILREASGVKESSSLTAKTWDLADAYKQVPLSDEAYASDAYLVVHSSVSKGPEVFQQKVLPFGSVASVTAFLRISHALWKLGSKLLGLLWSYYLDDFFLVAAGATSKHTDLIITPFFSILSTSVRQCM